MTISVITSAADALAYHKQWTSSIVLGYHPRIIKEFGDADLTDIFGPVGKRVSVRQLSEEEIESKVNAVRGFTHSDYYMEKGRLNLSSFGIINLIELQILKLRALKWIKDPLTDKPVLYGLQLDDYDLGVAFATGVPTNADICYVNVADVQRPIDMVRQMEYYLGNFDSGSVTGIIGRVDSSQDGIIIDDGQQGSTLALDHRLLTLGVNFGVRQGVGEDARLLLLSNIYKNPMKPFEIYKNQVIVAKDTAINKGGEKYIATSDRAAYYLDKICSDTKSNIRFKFEDSKIAAGECNTVAQFLKLFKIYCQSEYASRFVFQSAIRVTKKAFPFKAITQECPWMGSELFKQMPRKDVTEELIEELSEILGKQFVNSHDVWKCTSKARDAQYPKDDDRNERYYGEVVKGPLMAAAIVDLCRNYTAYRRAQPGAKTVKELTLPDIVDAAGRPIVISMPFRKPDGKDFDRNGTHTNIVASSNSELDGFLENA
jgi:hypothetical protein